MEGFKQPEGITEQEVIDALDSKGIEDSETKKLLERFVVQCQAQADAEVALNPESAEVSNRANIKAQIKIGRLLSGTKMYKNEALESLTDAYNVASQTGLTADLAGEIESLIGGLSY